MAKKPKRPRDPNRLAKLITDIASGDQEKPDDKSSNNKKTTLEKENHNIIKKQKNRNRFYCLVVFKYSFVIKLSDIPLIITKGCIIGFLKRYSRL